MSASLTLLRRTAAKAPSFVSLPKLLLTGFLLRSPPALPPPGQPPKCHQCCLPRADRLPLNPPLVDPIGCHPRGLHLCFITECPHYLRPHTQLPKLLTTPAQRPLRGCKNTFSSGQQPRMLFLSFAPPSSPVIPRENTPFNTPRPSSIEQLPLEVSSHPQPRLQVGRARLTPIPLQVGSGVGPCPAGQRPTESLVLTCPLSRLLLHPGPPGGGPVSPGGSSSPQPSVHSLLGRMCWFWVPYCCEGGGCRPPCCRFWCPVETDQKQVRSVISCSAVLSESLNERSSLSGAKLWRVVVGRGKRSRRP